MALSVEVLTSFGELAGARESWRRLLARSGDPQATLSPAWLLAWWRVYGQDGDRALRACLVYDRARLIGLAPLLSRTTWHRPGIPFRRLELIGSGEAEADEVTSEYIGVIAEAGRERSVAVALAYALHRGRLGAWDELVLERMKADSVMTRALGEELGPRAGRLEAKATTISHYVPLPSDWDAYLGRLSPSRRYRLKRALRDFERFTGGDYRLERAASEESFWRGFAILEELHRERWRAAGLNGAFASARFWRFHRDVAPALFRQGALDLLWLVARGEPVAAAYNLVWDGCVQFYQGGRRTDLPGAVKPGVVLHALAIGQAIRSGHREYDFLAGRARYKEELGPARRRIVSLRATPRRSAREGARRAAERSLRPLRDALVRRAPAPLLGRASRVYGTHMAPAAAEASEQDPGRQGDPAVHWRFLPRIGIR